MQHIHKICKHDLGILRPTAYSVIDLNNPEDVEKASRWWLDMTASGGEGMVVKPFQFISRDRIGLVQPAVIRGSEYLRIIYGSEYTEP